MHQHGVARLHVLRGHLHLQFAAGQIAAQLLQRQSVATCGVMPIRQVGLRMLLFAFKQRAVGLGHATVKTGQTLRRGTPTGQPGIAVDKPAQGILHLAKGVGDLNHVAQFDDARKIARRRHQKRKDDGGLTEK